LLAQADFYLQDGVAKVFINGSNRGQCKVQATDDGAGGSNYFSAPPPGVAWLIAQHCTSFGGWGMMSGRTGTNEHPVNLPCRSKSVKHVFIIVSEL
jgi:hypothetical protein